MLKTFFLLSISLIVGVTALHAEPQTLSRPDGTKIVYEVFGENNPETLLILHCWGCSRNYWDGIMPELSKEFRVVALDLPGMGDSSTPKKDWTFESMAGEVAALARELGLEKFIVVGHSMGGPLGLQLASMMKGQVEGLVCVDTLQNLDFDFKSRDFGMNEENFETSVRGFMPVVVHPQTDPQVLTRITDQALQSDHKVLLSLWSEFNRVSFPDLMKNAGVPVRCVNAVPYNDKGMNTEVGINRKYGDYDVILMEGTGHYPMLEKPEEFTKRLKEAVNKIKKVTRG